MTLADAPVWAKAYLAVAVVAAVVFWFAYMVPMTRWLADIGDGMVLAAIPLSLLAALLAPFVGLVWPGVLVVLAMWVVLAR